MSQYCSICGETPCGGGCEGIARDWMQSVYDRSDAERFEDDPGHAGDYVDMEKTNE